MSRPDSDDTWIWLGVGVALFLATRAVSHALHDTVRLTRIRNDPPPKHICTISARTEDDIDAGSLAVLAQSEDKDIRDSASRILADRFLSDQSAITSLTADFFSPNRRRRTRAHSLLHFLGTYAVNLGPVAWLHDHGPRRSREGLSAQISAVNESREVERRRRGLREHDGVGIGGRGVTRRVVAGREESFEEVELRRRRREAVVIHEGDGEVSQSDIIQRRGTGDWIVA